MTTPPYPQLHAQALRAGLQIVRLTPAGPRRVLVRTVYQEWVELDPDTAAALVGLLESLGVTAEQAHDRAA